MTIHVRRIAAGDAERLRGLRLAALTDAPGSFWQTAAAESARPGEDWRARARRNSAGDAHATFLLERRGGLVGMVDVHQPSLAPEFRELAAMWVAPAVRGTGAAGVLLDAAVNWARAVGAVGVRLWVVPTNRAAVGLYARHGFELIGDPPSDPADPPDPADPSDVLDDPARRVYVPMLLALAGESAASPTFRARALAPWTDESS